MSINSSLASTSSTSKNDEEDIRIRRMFPILLAFKSTLRDGTVKYCNTTSNNSFFRFGVNFDYSKDFKREGEKYEIALCEIKYPRHWSLFKITDTRCYIRKTFGESQNDDIVVAMSGHSMRLALQENEGNSAQNYDYEDENKVTKNLTNENILVDYVNKEVCEAFRKHEPECSRSMPPKILLREYSWCDEDNDDCEKIAYAMETGYGEKSRFYVIQFDDGDLKRIFGFDDEFQGRLTTEMTNKTDETPLVTLSTHHTPIVKKQRKFLYVYCNLVNRVPKEHKLVTDIDISQLQLSRRNLQKHEATFKSAKIRRLEGQNNNCELSGNARSREQTKSTVSPKNLLRRVRLPYGRGDAISKKQEAFVTNSCIKNVTAESTRSIRQRFDDPRRELKSTENGLNLQYVSLLLPEKCDFCNVCREKNSQKENSLSTCSGNYKCFLEVTLLDEFGDPFPFLEKAQPQRRSKQSTTSTSIMNKPGLYSWVAVKIRPQEV